MYCCKNEMEINNLIIKPPEVPKSIPYLQVSLNKVYAHFFNVFLRFLNWMCDNNPEWVGSLQNRLAAESREPVSQWATQPPEPPTPVVGH